MPKVFSKTGKNRLEKTISVRTDDFHRITQSLAESEERYHRMINEVEDYAILFINREGVIENWNIGAEKIKGYNSREIIGKNFSIFYTPEDRKSMLPEKLLRLAEKKGKATHEGWRVRKDGSIFWGYIVITAVHDNDNNIIGFSKVTRDLTEKKNAEDQVREANEKLRQKNLELLKMNEELEAFAYVSSHDLQEPLRKIQTYVGLILAKENERLSDSGKNYLELMRNSASRMQTLIHDLLKFSRLNSEDNKMENMALQTLVKEAKSEFHEIISEKMAVIQSDNCKIRVIPFQFRQLFFNLISNALKFSSPTRPPKMTITCKKIKYSHKLLPTLPPLDFYCHIQFRDNGIGFEKEYSKKIFEVFQRLHSRDEYEGTGIGLAIVKKIVENHRGMITATSKPNKGATFDIYIPAV